MKSSTAILLVSLGCLLVMGCGKPQSTESTKQSESERTTAEEVARTQRFEEHVANGKEAMEAKQFEEAAKHFREAKSLKNTTEIRELLDQAEKSLAEVRKAAHDKAMLQGAQALKEKNYPAALAAFREAQRQLPDTEAADAIQSVDRARQFEEHVAKGKIALESKQFEKAVKNFRAAISLKDDFEVRHLLQQAEKAWEVARKAAHDQAMLQGAQALKEKNYAAAVTAFQEAVRQLPEKAAVAALQDAEFHDFLEKGQASLKAEQYADAVKALGEATKRQPNDIESRDLLKQAQVKRRLQAMEQGQAALKAKQYPDAVRLFTEAKALLSDAEVTALLTEANFQVKLQLGRKQVETKQFAAAIPALEEADRIKPGSAETRDLLQKAKEGKKQEVKADYDRLLSSGKSSLSSGRYDDAIRDLQKAKQLIPEQTEAPKLLGEAQGKKRDYESHLNSGKSHLTSRRYTVAIREFREAEKLSPFGDTAAASGIRDAESKKRDYESHLSNGKFALTAQRYDDAIRAYREAEKLSPFGDTAAASGIREAEAAKKQTAMKKR